MKGKGKGGGDDGILGEAGAGVAIGIAGETLVANAKARRSRATRTVERADAQQTFLFAFGFRSGALRVSVDQRRVDVGER